MTDFHQTMLTAGVWMIVAALYGRSERVTDMIAGGAAAIAAVCVLLAGLFG